MAWETLAGTEGAALLTVLLLHQSPKSRRCAGVPSVPLSTRSGCSAVALGLDCPVDPPQVSSTCRGTSAGQTFRESVPLSNSDGQVDTVRLPEVASSHWPSALRARSSYSRHRCAFYKGNYPSPAPAPHRGTR